MAASHSVDPDGWMVLFNELMARIAGRFGRVEPRCRRTAAYVRGLLADIYRKNCWNLAEHAGLIAPPRPSGQPHLAAIIKHHLKRLQYRPDLLAAIIARPN